ncbi:hypothetical protein [Streptomyces sp. NPDC005970]|uniref:hypothetical protein n=1 Tax=Streptomyces sp. NPDC005970 TaxID=3156723 RepID=UPI0033DBC71A
MAQGASRGLVAMSAGALLGGCSSGADGAGPKDPGMPPDLGVPPSGSVAPKASPSAAGPDFTVRPDRVPDTSARALRLARRVIAGPDDFGAGFVRQRPFESGPDTWAVLDETCV